MTELLLLTAQLWAIVIAITHPFPDPIGGAAVLWSLAVIFDRFSRTAK